MGAAGWDLGSLSQGGCPGWGCKAEELRWQRGAQPFWGGSAGGCSPPKPPGALREPERGCCVSSEHHLGMGASLAACLPAPPAAVGTPPEVQGMGCRRWGCSPSRPGSGRTGTGVPAFSQPGPSAPSKGQAGWGRLCQPPALRNLSSFRRAPAGFERRSDGHRDLEFFCRQRRASPGRLCREKLGSESGLSGHGPATCLSLQLSPLQAGWLQMLDISHFFSPHFHSSVPWPDTHTLWGSRVTLPFPCPGQL